MGMKRLDPTNPEDLATLVATGLIWNASVPTEYKSRAFDAIAEGTIPPNSKVPADALAAINEVRAASGQPPLVVEEAQPLV